MRDVYRLVFNGRDFPERFGVSSFTVSTPRVDISTLDVPGRRGDIRTSKSYGNRAIQIGCVPLVSSLEDGMDALAELTEWCQSDAPAPMYIPGCHDSYITVECDQYPPAYLQALGSEIVIGFTAAVPDFIETVERTAAVDGGAFTVGGTLPVFPVVRQTIPGVLNGPIWVVDNGIQIRLDGQISGKELTIDTERERVTVDGEDYTHAATLESTLGFTLAPGRHTVVGNNGAGGVVAWHNARLWGHDA